MVNPVFTVAKPCCFGLSAAFRCYCLYYCFAENTPVPVRVTRVRGVTSAGPVNQFTSVLLSIL